MAAPSKSGKMGGKKAATKLHYCPEHGDQVKPIQIMPGKRIVFECPKNHRISKGQTSVQYPGGTVIES